MGSAERTSEELVTMKYAAVFCLLLIVLLTASTEAKKRGKGGMRKGHRCKDNPIKLCGSDGETYENQCLFWKAKKANKKLTARPGGCNEDTLCPVPCPDIYKPICGSDDITYDTKCHLLDAKHCDSKPDLRMAHKGECKPKDCTSAKQTGPCRALFTRWYYDTSEEKCKSFVYGGCKGTPNRYLTEDSCKTECAK